MDSRRMLRLSLLPVLLVLVGCHDGVVVYQSWKLRITDVLDGEPASDATVYHVDSTGTRAAVERGDSIDHLVGITYLADTNGFVDIDEGTFVICFRETSLIGRIQCSDVPAEDFHTGTVKGILIEEGPNSEFLDYELREGVKVDGELFSVEVISVGEPSLF